MTDQEHRYDYEVAAKDDNERLRAEMEARDRALNPHEAVMAFAAWLTMRDEPVTLSANHDASIAADLVQAFAKSQNLPEIREDYADRIVAYPSASGGGG